jgi:hypothetical protein
MRSGSLHQTGDFLGILAAEAEQHEKRPDLMWVGLASKDHAKGGLRFVPGQGA